MNKLIKLWGIPVVIALLTIGGLLAALNGTGIWHWISWCMLSVPVVAMIWYIYKAFYKKES